MTFGKWYRLFKHYQNHHDIKVKGVTYEQLRAESSKKNGEWI